MKARFILFIPSVSNVAMCLCQNDPDKEFHEMEDDAVVYRKLDCTKMNIIENNGKALAIISTFKKRGEQMVSQLKADGSVVPLGCIDGNAAHREKPSSGFSESDWSMIEQIIPDVDRNNFIGDLR